MAWRRSEVIMADLVMNGVVYFSKRRGRFVRYTYECGLEEL